MASRISRVSERDSLQFTKWGISVAQAMEERAVLVMGRREGAGAGRSQRAKGSGKGARRSAGLYMLDRTE